MAPPGAGPAGIFSLCGPPSRDPLDMVPQHIRQFHGRPSGGSSFQENYPVGQLSGFTLRHCMPPGQNFSEPSSGGPSFQGPWQISSPSEFSSQHPICLRVFQNLVCKDKISLGCTHHPLGLIICERSALGIHHVKINVLFGVFHWFIKGASSLHECVQLGQES